MTETYWQKQILPEGNFTHQSLTASPNRSFHTKENYDGILCLCNREQ